MEDQIFPVPRPVAQAILHGDPTHSQLMGEVSLSPYGKGTLLILRAVGLPPSGFLGFHIHDKGDCSTGGDVPFVSAGGHYDLHNVSHPWHGGDLPPLLASSDGVALMAVYSDRFQPKDVIGRSIILHETADDFHSQPAGNSGLRIACGIINSI